MSTILIVSQFYEPSVNFIIGKLEKQGIKWARFNTELYPLITSGSWGIDKDRLTSTIRIDGKLYSSDDISSVWNRRFGEPLTSKDLNKKEKSFVLQEARSFIRTFLDSLTDAFWINKRQAELDACDKTKQLQIAKGIGLSIPKTLISNNPEEILEFHHLNSKNTVFKPLSGVSYTPPENDEEIYSAYADNFTTEPEISIRSHLEETPIIFTQKLDEVGISRIANAAFCPTIYQEYIDKKLELRVTVVGTDIFTCAIHSQEHLETATDFRRFAKFNDVNLKHTVFQLPVYVEEKIILMMNTMGLVFGCFDLILTPSDEYVFLEVNPSGQWMWIEQLTGMKISNALISALVKGSSNS